MRMVRGTIKPSWQSLTFQCGDGDTAVSCSITKHAIDDLIQIHRFDFSKDEAFDALLQEIEEMVTGKVFDRRLEPNGEVVLRAIDIKKYGTIGGGKIKQVDPL